jgi:flagellar hook-associated protein 1 FlgK
MGSLTAALGNSGASLDVLQRALGIIQANVSNASTPGYATQKLDLQALPMDSATNSAGGVSAAGISSARDQYADTAVELQLQSLGLYTAQSQVTGTIQGLFDVTGASGVSSALTSLFTAFSSWSASPGDPSARQAVLAAATNVASSITGLSTSLRQTASQVGQQTESTVGQINSLAGQIRQYNVTRLSSGADDPGAQAQLQTNLESLANLVNFTALTQADGTVTVLVGGGTPLVMEDRQYSLTAGQSVNAQPPPVNPVSQVFDSQGNEITATITGGQLGGLLDSQNRVLAGIVGDAHNTGSLNTLASNLADTVNQILESGTVSSSPGAAAGTALFSYSNAGAGQNPADSLAVVPSITPAQLAPVDASGVSNGNALALAGLTNPAGAQGTINGMSYTQYFASIASAVGTDQQTAQTNQTVQKAVVTQAQSLRDSISGVSLDAQAALLLQFQRGYQSVARVLTVINSLADSVLALVPQV